MPGSTRRSKAAAAPPCGPNRHRRRRRSPPRAGPSRPRRTARRHLHASDGSRRVIRRREPAGSRLYTSGRAMPCRARGATRRTVAQQFAVEPRPPDSTTRPRRWPQAIAAAACTAVVIIAPKSIAPAVKVTLILLATVVSIELSRREARDPGDPRPIALTVGALFTLAVADHPEVRHRHLVVHDGRAASWRSTTSTPTAPHRPRLHTIRCSRCCTGRGRAAPRPTDRSRSCTRRSSRWSAARIPCSTGSRSS